jgi:hypothetical protein
MILRVTVLLLSTIALILIAQGVGAPLVATAQALHNCGEPHKGKHVDDDDDHGGVGAEGCRNLDEDDFFYGDPRPDAPELAYRGPLKVGVRTVQVVNENQIDILNYSPENPNPRYDRP